ncbi:unnamed protein product [Amoebophrya sp. A25]|nr:unnamed protein product [Amoebophrya sp. A25]|eukprot:GSA25T00026857001.1
MDRPATAPADAKGEIQKARQAMAEGRPVVSMVKVAGIMNQYASMKKIQLAGNRRNVRESDAMEKEMERIHHVIAELIVAMDFKFFERMSLKQLVRTAGLMEVRKFTAGETIFRKGTTGVFFMSNSLQSEKTLGDKIKKSILPSISAPLPRPGHHFYCLFLGEVDILLQEGARPIACLGPGESFGELALINDTPRAATVRAKTAVLCGLLSRHTFTQMQQNQEAIQQAQCYACVNHCIPFSEYIPPFKRKMAAIMEPRTIQCDRELNPGTNGAEHLVITRKGSFEVLADIELNMPESTSQIRYDQYGNAVVAEAKKIRKSFKRVPIMKLDKPGLVYGMGECLMPGGADAPGVRDWVPGAAFLQIYLVARGDGGATAFVIPKKKFRALLKEEMDMKRWCERYHQVKFRYHIAQVNSICQTLNRSDFLMKKSFYMIKIYEEIDDMNKKFQDQVEWRYFLEDIRERGAEKMTWQRLKAAAEQRFAGKRNVVLDPELQPRKDDGSLAVTRDKTWDYI